MCSRCQGWCIRNGDVAETLNSSLFLHHDDFESSKHHFQFVKIAEKAVELNEVRQCRHHGLVDVNESEHVTEWFPRLRIKKSLRILRNHRDSHCGYVLGSCFSLHLRLISKRLSYAVIVYRLPLYL